ncbi:hypothetical protein SAMN04489727_4580 [Amycolatopsis tolypomycina]|uniref:Uncharacterized protein n=1 Tax=Amycolatopsis tolypomycina TaxID=208445 RepID=A0A1H4UB65_9PSEU|nr:hypothetical protein [Amycolatopsis tolypomycina]SEC66009.1 hypothetical protein SAMN04489727_4580 [Amycolatopsis tolypomycina]
MSGQDGYIAFFGLPADRSDVGIVGPWRSYYAEPVFLVRGDDDGSLAYRNLIVVVPGADQPDPDAVPPTAKPPGRRGRCAGSARTCPAGC